MHAKRRGVQTLSREQQLTRITGKSDLAKAARYGMSRWPWSCLFLEEGRVAIDNNCADRAMRPIGIGRKTRLLAGVDLSAETQSTAMTLIETAKLNIYKCHWERIA